MEVVDNDNGGQEDEEYFEKMRSLLMQTQNDVEKIIGAAPKVVTQ